LSGSGIVWASRRVDWGVAAALGLTGALALAIALLPLTWSTLLVVASVVLVASLVQPKVGLLLVMPSVPFGSLRQVSVGVMSVGVTEALVALVLVAWLMRRVARRCGRLKLPPLVLPLVAFLVALFLSLLTTSSLQHSIKEIVKWVEVLVLYVLVYNEVEGRWTRAVVFVALGTGALAALQGIYQFLFRVGPEEFILFGRFMRAYGTFEQPNPYAGYLGLGLPLAVGLALAPVTPSAKRVGGRWLLWAAGCGAMMLTALVMSWSRGAWLGFGAAIAGLIIAVAARSGRVMALGLVFAVLAGYVLVAGGVALVPPSIVQRFADFVPYLGVTDVRGVEVTDANFAVLERMAHWQSALDMWTDKPWLGVGIGNYEPVYASYALPQWPLPLGHAHNYYLNIAAEAGLVGLVAYVSLWGMALLQAWRAARRATGWRLGVALGVLGMLIHLCVHSFFDNLYVHGMYLHVAVLLGIRTTEDRVACLARSVPASGRSD
jgi:O-antigen ligase